MDSNGNLGGHYFEIDDVKCDNFLQFFLEIWNRRTTNKKQQLDWLYAKRLKTYHFGTFYKPYKHYSSDRHHSIHCLANICKPLCVRLAATLNRKHGMLLRYGAIDANQWPQHGNGQCGRFSKFLQSGAHIARVHTCRQRRQANITDQCDVSTWPIWQGLPFYWSPAYRHGLILFFRMEKSYAYLR